MAARKKIVFPYYNSYYTSTAIIIYQTNIIKTLKLLPDEIKPHLFIWHTHQSPLKEVEDIDYPYITYVDIKSTAFRIKKLMSVVCEKLGLGKSILFNKEYDCIYPSYHDSFLNGIKRRIYWKADFQENYYPQYFTPAEIDWVKQFFGHLKADPESPLVLSSNDAWADLKKFYPEIKNPVLLFRFVSHVKKEIVDENADPILKKFNVHKPYFIVCNQYWPHKNHLVVLKALAILKSKNALPFCFVFTGKTSSIRGDNYYTDLKRYMQQNDLENDIVVTDFLERSEQLLLMKNAIAIVQPTTFEGWSTVIEDAKALSQYVIASNIAVNLEQVSENVTFFNPANEVELASILENNFLHPPVITPLNYQLNIQHSMNDLRAIFQLG